MDRKMKGRQVSEKEMARERLGRRPQTGCCARPRPCTYEGVRRAARGGYLLLLGMVLLPAADVRAQAYVGEPFGVGRVVLRGDGSANLLASQTNGFRLTEAQDRALYPVFVQGGLRRLLGQVLGKPHPLGESTLTVCFLFRGQEPLDVTIWTPEPQTFRVVPQAGADPRRHREMLSAWWRDYHAAAEEQIEQGDYYPLVETYLTTMLGRRLGLSPPSPHRAPKEPLATLQMLGGAESLRLAILRETSSGEAIRNEAADQPLPDAAAWVPAETPAVTPDVEIEPIAMRVPRECFYLRFGSFENYLWMDRLQRDYGGDLGRMITLRGVRLSANERLQQQMGLRRSALDELMGPTIVSDVAIIGRDMFFRDGAATGILFQARNGLLGTGLSKQRNDAFAQQKADGARMETVTIGGRDVSFLSTPTNRLRSFYVVDGDYHLVTTSRQIVERFLAVRDGTGSLGASEEFRHARSLLPTSREDTIFAYFSSAFLQGLLSPHYQVELRRRFQATANLELIRMASWTADREGHPAKNLDDLVQGGYLPPGFGTQADGSRPARSGATLVDSLRGARGTFVPIADVPVAAITPTEAARLQGQAEFFGGEWKRLDPLLAGIRRYALEGERRERIVIDAQVSPFAQQQYGWITSLLGPPTRAYVQPAPGDIITAHAVVQGGKLLPQIPLHHLFLGIQDTDPLANPRPVGLLQTLQFLRATPGYLGGWPKPGYLDLLPVGLSGGPPDASGFSRLLLGVWRRQWDAFSVLGFDPNLLAEVTPHLRPIEVDNEAQLRVYVGDLSQSRLRGWVNSLTAERALQASVGNAKLLHALSQQMGVPPAQALREAENLLNADLVCTLGGDYRLESSDEATTPLWLSTAWPPDSIADPPADYQTPLLEWFRGAQTDLTMYGDQVVVHAQLDMERKASEPAVSLPLFNLFGGSEGARKLTPKPPPAEEIQAPPKQQPQGPREF